MLSSEIKKYWIVPINVEAACVGELNAREDTVNWFGQTADLSYLPYRYRQGGREFLHKDAHISENLVTPPFQTTNAPLERGIHLHWALPGAMANGVHDPDTDALVFPEVPNRWIVVRRVSINGTLDSGSAKSWMVESDHISTEARGGSTAFPVRSDDKPFRYIGRVYELSGTAPRGEGYLESLTAIGYGDPIYSVYFPDCRNVFGFSDQALDIPDGAQVAYRVYGYYAQPERDLLREAIRRAQEQRKETAFTADDLSAILESEYQWKNVLPETGVPDAILCCGLVSGISWNQYTDYAGRYKPETAQLNATVAIGNATTETLAALLANRADPARHDPQLEYLLNALQVGQLTELDIAGSLTRIEEAMHQNAFGVDEGGSQWIIKKNTEQTSPPVDANGLPVDSSASLEFAAAFRRYRLPADLVDDLDHLNQLQLSADRLEWEIETRRRQLFADWYKYIVTEYEEKGVEVNEMRLFMESRVMPELTALMEQREQKEQQLMDALIQLQRDLDDFNQSIRTALAAQNIGMGSDQGYSMEKSPAPRFWHANEPVLLFCGEDIQPSKRYGNSDQLKAPDGNLPGGILAVSLEDAVAGDAVIDTLRQLLPGIDTLSTWDPDRWNPHFLQWEVEFHPLQKLNNRHGWTGTFAPDYITENYTLDKNNIELTFSTLAPEEPQVMQGITLLSDRAVISMKEQISQFIDRYEDADELTETEQTEKDLLTQLVQSVDQLGLLSQSLGGFNAGLLMHKQTLQLSVKDPVTGNDFLRDFTDRVGRLVDGLIDAAPLPHNSFIPLRTGLLKLSKLCLVDTFGRYRSLDSPQPIVSQHLLPPLGTEINQPVYLPPRIVQPSRLLFNLLDADTDLRQVSTHPDSNPIFGWVMPNFLDNSLLIYDQQGNSVCTLMLNGAADSIIYEAAPGKDQPITYTNPHLSAFVGGLLENGAGYLADLMRTMDVALTHIEPAHFRQQQHTAVLFGQPMALVRASLRLEIKGPPAHNQSYESFQADIINQESESRDTNGFSHVQFPVRLGDLAKLEDGLVGYFLDVPPGGTDYRRFYTFAAAGTGDSGPGISQPKAEQIVLAGDDRSGTQYLTMLIDPRASIHATTGILPVYTIRISPEQYQDALDNIKATFLTTHLISPKGDLRLPLPKENGYAWSWIEKVQDSWFTQTGINSTDTEAKSGYSPQRIREGWLQLAKKDAE